MKISGCIGGAILLLCLPGAAWPAEVYSWTDTEGVTHYSETPPADRSDSTLLELEPVPVVASPAADDYYSVANQAARMEARRLEQERQRAEIQRLRAEARRAAAAAEATARDRADAAAVQQQEPHYYPLYPWPPYGHRPRPHRYEPARAPYPPSRRNKQLVVNPERP